jgi:hypothetical protein
MCVCVCMCVRVYVCGCVGGWRNFHDDLPNLYPSPNIIGVIESRRMKWVMGGACSTNGVDRKCAQNVGWKMWR